MGQPVADDTPPNPPKPAANAVGAALEESGLGGVGVGVGWSVLVDGVDVGVACGSVLELAA